MVSSQTRCLEPEVLAAYVDHGLSLAERLQVETHLASCRQCTAVLAWVVRTGAEVSAFIPDTGAAEATLSQTRRTVVAALGAAAAVVAVLVVPPLAGPWLERDAGLVSLVDSVAEQRSVLGRLSGGFPHAPLSAPSAGGQDGRTAGTDRVLLTAGRIRESFGELATPSRLHAMGVSQLLAGRHDEAVQSLLAASREQPANARYLSDVAAVQLERARLGLRPDDLPRALAAADRARRLDPSLNEAWFNRALALSALSLTDQARGAWTEYLQRDSVSPWAAEARARLVELAKPTAADAWATLEGRLEQSLDAATADAAVRVQTTEARNFIENELFEEWANAVLAGHSGAPELDRVRVMAEAMLRIAGDALYRDTVATIDRNSDANQTRRLASAFKEYAAANALLETDRFSEALAGLTRSEQQLLALGSPVAELALLGVGTAHYVQGQYDHANRVLSSVLAAADSKSHAYASGRANWIRGMTAFAQGRFGDAQAMYDDSLSTFERMVDVEQAGGAHNLLSSLAYQLGDTAAEWRHRQAALEAMSVSRSPRFKHTTLVTAAVSTRSENPEAALVVLDTVLLNARESGRVAAVVDALAQRSSTLLSLGRASEASQSAAEARGHLAKISDPAFRAILALPVLAVESDLLRHSNPREAAVVASQGIATAETRGDRARLPQFQLRLARANIVLGRLDDAERALVAGIEAFDSTRARPAGAIAVSTFDESWQLFETAEQLAIRRGDYERAFAMAERGRAHAPPNIRGRVDVPSLADVQNTVRPGEAIIALNQFDDELVLWVIRNQETSVIRRPIRKSDAQRLVARQQDEIRLQVERPGASAALYDAVVRPLASKMSGVTRVVFIPDATYRDVSFSGLWDRSQNRFLVEHWILSAAPSVAVVVASSAGTSTVSRSNSILVLSSSTDPATAETIARQYGSAEIAVGANATPAKLLGGTNSVMHLAAPTHRNPAYPLLSRLILHDEPGRRYSGVVLSQEIIGRSMGGTKLVVLDDIRTQQGYRTAGAFDLASAFLAAGVPAVLGTLPGADEGATRELMVGFHREMAEQASAADALTRVQRNALQQNGRRLGAWTALVLYGSDRSPPK